MSTFRCQPWRWMRAWSLPLLAVVLAAGEAVVAQAEPAVVPVADAAGLHSALAEAKDGQTISLAPGVYAERFLLERRTFATPLTIASADPAKPAELRGLTMLRVANVVVRGLRFVDPADGPEDYVMLRFEGERARFEGNAFLGSRFASKTAASSKGGKEDDGYFKNRAIQASGDDLAIVGNEMTRVSRGIVGNGKRLVIRSNYIHDYREDGMTIGETEDGLIEHNIVYNVMPFLLPKGAGDHPDMIQIRGNQVNLVVRWNYLNQGPGDPALFPTQGDVEARRNSTHGILAGVGTGKHGPEVNRSRDVLFHGNIIITTQLHGLSALDYDGVTVSNNLVLDGHYGQEGGTTSRITVSGEAVRRVRVTGNVAFAISTGGAKGRILAEEGNVVLEREDRASPRHWSRIFAAADRAVLRPSLADLRLTAEGVALIPPGTGPDFTRFTQFSQWGLDVPAAQGQP